MLLRLVLYGGAITLIALHFWPHSASATPLMFTGTTAQDEEILVGLNALDRVSWIQTQITGRCRGGPLTVPWNPHASVKMPFHVAGDRVHVEEVQTYGTERLVVTLDGIVPADGGHASGVLRMKASFKEPPLSCDSSPVKWEASR